jgi:copper homeostasis protein
VRITLEIAVSTPEEAAGAVQAGADRLELSAGLELGGLTPSPGVFERVRNRVDVPVWVLLRPRPGGFEYSGEELAAICRDAEYFLGAGADGLVFGALDARDRIPADACRRLIDLAGGRVAFHRAFDFAADPAAVLEQLIELGFARVLTSGGEGRAVDGAERIAELIARAAGRIAVMPGGGVRPENVAELVRTTRCAEVHAAARSSVRDAGLIHNARLAPSMGTGTDGTTFATDTAIVAGLRRELDRLTTMTACPTNCHSRPSSNSS